jgi:hypothetical protein
LGPGSAAGKSDFLRKNARIALARFDEIKPPLPPTKLLVFGADSGVIGHLLAELKKEANRAIADKRRASVAKAIMRATS